MEAASSQAEPGLRATVVPSPASEKCPHPEGPFGSGKSAASPGKSPLTPPAAPPVSDHWPPSFPRGLPWRHLCQSFRPGGLPANEQAQTECGGTVFSWLKNNIDD